MTSLTQVTDQLFQCERQITAIRLKAEEKKAVVWERAKDVEKRREELLKSHGKRVEDTQEEYECQLKSIVDRAEEDMTNFELLHEKARNRAEMAEQGKRDAELRARQLERELQQLHAIMNNMLDQTDNRFKQVCNSTNDRVNQMEEEANNACRDMALSASETQEDTMDIVETLRDELRIKVDDAEVESVNRSRFKDYLAVSESFGGGWVKADNPVAQKQQDRVVRDARMNVLQDWYGDWVRTNSSLGQRAVQTAFRKSPTYQREGPRGTPSPIDKDRPRSVDRQKQRVLELQAERGRRGRKSQMYGYRTSIDSKDTNIRPGTAPGP